MNQSYLPKLKTGMGNMVRSFLLLCLFLSLSIGSFAQEKKSIYGYVKETDEQPLVGVNVKVKGTQNGTITDIDGKYTLNNVTPGQVIVYSMIGMTTVEKTVGNQPQINVVMKSGIEIDEVIVTGYQTQRKIDLTGSVSSLNSEQFMKTNPLSMEQALKGKIAGVQVMNNDGAPGGELPLRCVEPVLLQREALLFMWSTVFPSRSRMIRLTILWLPSLLMLLKAFLY